MCTVSLFSSFEDEVELDQIDEIKNLEKIKFKYLAQIEEDESNCFAILNFDKVTH